VRISEICITLRDEEKLKAFANITFDDCFVIHGVKVIQGPSGYFVSMPSRKKDDGTYRDIAHPTNQEMRKMIEECILKAYSAAFAKDMSTEKPGARSRTFVERDTVKTKTEWPDRLRQSG